MKSLNKSNNIVWHNASITRAHREKLNGQKSALLWFTGLSGSGKSTIANAVEEKLYNLGCRTYVLDGDNVRHGLCGDLGFSPKDRTENIRRIGETGKLFVDAGFIVMTAFISPYITDRESVKDLLGKENFIDIFCDCSLRVCEQRDVKGHYAKARSGEIPEFTGISAPYEVPEKPDIYLKTDTLSIEESVNFISKYLLEKKIIEG